MTYHIASMIRLKWSHQNGQAVQAFFSLVKVSGYSGLPTMGGLPAPTRFAFKATLSIKVRRTRLIIRLWVLFNMT